MLQTALWERIVAGGAPGATSRDSRRMPYWESRDRPRASRIVPRAIFVLYARRENCMIGTGFGEAGAHGVRRFRSERRCTPFEGVGGQPQGMKHNE